jgi:hypothetical protein
MVVRADVDQLVVELALVVENGRLELPLERPSGTPEESRLRCVTGCRRDARQSCDAVGCIAPYLEIVAEAQGVAVERRCLSPISSGQRQVAAAAQDDDQPMQVSGLAGERRASFEQL